MSENALMILCICTLRYEVMNERAFNIPGWSPPGTLTRHRVFKSMVHSMVLTQHETRHELYYLDLANTIFFPSRLQTSSLFTLQKMKSDKTSKSSKTQLTFSFLLPLNCHPRRSLCFIYPPTTLKRFSWKINTGRYPLWLWEMYSVLQCFTFVDVLVQFSRVDDNFISVFSAGAERNTHRSKRRVLLPVNSKRILE